ncbi:ABC transporter permease [Kibdelosporangium phytohabitans]|uniref:Transport permease protein n=1 Tax=Kibdelosporangium phytohabitans TaxID=860235 RepID=A0A0N9HWB4_9PSEU|nr:ABC transporter permease [Kibdelosporangium phytohabitans]ALG09541.1 ABC transporter permease [Kibdelosporangium phytohabitans]MBE1469146.1 ABC-2 type transport system permease protein [Kibdelosporangium phytohabitans]
MNTDAAIMLRRNFKHTVRNPVTLFNAVFLPVLMMLMFVYVFGDAFSVGGGDYINYATPGMLMMTLAYGLSATAVAVNSDMTKGIINRFKVMDVSRGAVLTGHVVSTVVRTVAALTVILGVAFLMGFSPAASFPQWLAAIGVLLLTSIAVSWLVVAMGLAAKTQESAGFASVPLIMLPFFSSAIVPADKMGPGVREFAEYQPFTPIIESVRGLLNGTPSTGHTIAAIAWCVGITVVGYVWARRKFTKRA